MRNENRYDPRQIVLTGLARIEKILVCGRSVGMNMSEGMPPNLNDRHYHFELSAEFNQFYLQDESVKGEVDWTVQEGHDNLAYNFGIIAVGTNCDRVVPVEVQILSSEPPLNAERWDHLVDCSIDVPSGRLVISGLFEEFATAARINLEPGRYRARVCYGNQYFV